MAIFFLCSLYETEYSTGMIYRVSTIENNNPKHITVPNGPRAENG